MSHHPSARELHENHEDARNEASARVRQAVRLEDALTAGRLAGELHVRRLGALQNTSGLPSDDFDGAVIQVPFIVTTKRVGLVHGADGEEGPFEATLSRRAVATLEEARQWVEKAMIDRYTPGHAAEFRPFDEAIKSLSKPGGTVGPLPDGTVADVSHASWDDLVGPGGWNAHSTEADVIAAYNARVSS